MQVLLFRHGERENLRLENPPLSERGRSQSLKLRELVTSLQLALPSRLLVSPRLRSQETFTPLAQALSLELQVTADLDERLYLESSLQFSQRIKRFIQALETQSGVVYLCTHLDWIEEALITLPSQDGRLALQVGTWTTAQYIEFDVHDGLWFIKKSGRIT